MPEVNVTPSESIKYFGGMYLKMLFLDISNFKLFL